MIGVVLIVAMRAGYWSVAGRHSLRGEALRERDTSGCRCQHEPVTTSMID
jgi:hypothetical protein